MTGGPAPESSTAWKAGDTCGTCRSTNTVLRLDGILEYGHCNACGADDEDE